MFLLHCCLIPCDHGKFLISDIFHKINKLNKSVQEKNQTQLGVTGKLTGFKRKLNLWKNNLESFFFHSYMNLILEETNASFARIKQLYVQHFDNLI